MGDVLYHKEYADSWNVSFEGRNFLISLSYGNVLSKGVGSDLMLHPKLNVHFDNKTNDIYFVYRAYSIVIKFLQIIRYDLNFGRNIRAVCAEKSGGGKPQCNLEAGSTRIF